MPRLIIVCEKTYMPPRQISFQQVHLSCTPTQTPPLSRHSTYTTFINQKVQARAPLSQTSPDVSEEEHPQLSFWSRNITYYSSITKDDMLLVLKGKNYKLPAKIDRKSSAANLSSKDPRAILKSMTVNTESNCLKRVRRQKHERSKRDTLKRLDAQRNENQKKFLTKNLRFQKWLQLSRWQGFRSD